MNQQIKKQIDAKTEELQVKAKVMSKWYEWDALQKLVTPEQYQQGTFCKSVSKTENKTMYEYDCYFRFAKTENQIGYFDFYYYEDGLLLTKIYVVFYYGTHIEIKLHQYAQVGYNPAAKNRLDGYTFIGNWRDGQEFLSKQIDKLRREDANQI
jgi:hypothetical protein